MALPRIFNNFGVFIDGRGYIGRAEEVELPKLGIKAEEFRGGGMDAPIAMDMGMEKIECSISLGEYDPAAAGLLGLHNASTPFTLRGAYKQQDGQTIAVTIKLVGGVKEREVGKWKTGDKVPFKMTIACTMYSESANGGELIYIDIPNMIRRVNGADQLAEIRAAIGA